MKVDIKIKGKLEMLINLKRQKFLRVNHEYQRGLKWTTPQKLMFIDSIFRGYSIPAFYFHKIESSIGSLTNTFYDIVDGQQRIDAIYSYIEGAFPLLDPASDSDFRFPNFVKDIACPWAGKRFEELNDHLKDKILNTTVVVYEISDTNDNEIRDLFIRLQGGTPLTPQDKRDSWPGKFTEFVLTFGGKSDVPKWYGSPVFTEVAKVQNESRRRQLVAQIFMLFWSTSKERKFCDLKSVNIDQFYHQHVDFDQESYEAQRFKKICQKLHKALRDGPKIAGHYLIHLFILLDALLDDYLPTWENELSKALFEFEGRCRQASKDIKNDIPDSEFAKYWYSYAQWTRTNSDMASMIQKRHVFFSEEMSKLLDLNKRDDKRAFNEFERTTVFFRDRKLCQYCKMKGEEHGVSWDECEIHHVVPYTDGGATNIENAALMHKTCHPRDQRAVEEFQRYWSNLTHNYSPEKTRRGSKRRSLPPDGTKVKFERGGWCYSGSIVDREIDITKNHTGRYKSFSEASKAITNTSRNGWNDWYIQLSDESDWILAKIWRDSDHS